MITRKINLSAMRSVPSAAKSQKDTGKSSISKRKLDTSIGSFSKLITFLLLLMTGCNNIQPTKQEEKTLTLPNHSRLNPSIAKNKDHIDRELEDLTKNLFRGHLLIDVDRFGELIYDPNGKALIAQELLSERLTPEIFPVLWNKVFLEGPDEIIVAKHTELGNFNQSDDFGRGLRLILRRKVGDLNISTILFLDYNEETKKLEFPNDVFFRDKRRIIPDAMRTLIEYDVRPTNEQLKGHKKNYNYDHLSSGFFGTTISAEIEDKTPKVLDLHIHPTRDKNDEYPLGKNGRFLDSVSLLSCIGCHGKNEEGEKGFVSIGTSFEETQRTVHHRSHQKKAIKGFIEDTDKNKRFGSEQEKTAILRNLEKQLHSPKKNFKALLPTGLFKALERKQNRITNPSTVFNRYNVPSSLRK